MKPTLSFEQAPPISVPYRFFLTAPLFGIVAGLILAGFGPDALSSRWSQAALAMTHLIVVDFMLQAMCGALLQFVAVVAGANIWRPRLVAAWVHPMITLGALFLASAFLFELPVFFLLAAIVFSTALGFFLIVMAIALLRTPARGMTIHVLRLSLLGLLATVVLGVTMASILGLRLDGAPLLLLINVHVAWGLGGWALMLVIGVSYLVVPMFQLTPAYPTWLTRLLPIGMLLVLLAWSAQLLAGHGEPQGWHAVVGSAAASAGMALAALYAAWTLWLQAHRRRKQADITLLFWRGAMVSLLGIAVSWLVFEIAPALGAHARAPLWLGMLAVPGLFLSVIVGMLYKIMPFLNWLHLQRASPDPLAIPNMKQMIPESAQRAQMRMHFAALILLLAAVLWPQLARVAGVVFAASCVWLEWNLVGAVNIYRRVRESLTKSRAVATAALRDEMREAR